MTTMEKTVVVKESVLVNAPPERVWRVFSHLDRWPQWNRAVLGARWLKGQPWMLGSAFEMTIKPSWKKLNVRPEIVESGPPQQVIWLGKGAGIHGQHTFTFQPEGDGTRATSLEVFSGPMLWIMPLIGSSGSVGRMFKAWLAALKAEVERTP